VITRQEASQIVKAVIKERRLPFVLSEIYRDNEIPYQNSLFHKVDCSQTWIAYLVPFLVIGFAATFAIIDAETGAVRYVGSSEGEV